MLDRGDREHLCAAPAPSVPNRGTDPRRRVLDAFVRVVARDGYERATIERVLALAEVPWPVFAEHFEGKRDCLLVALDELAGEFERELELELDRSTSWPEMVRAGLRKLLEALSANPDGARLALVECLGAGEPALRRLRDAMDRCAAMLDQGRRVRGARERGAGSGDDAGGRAVPWRLPAQTSEAVAGGIVSIVHRRVLEGRTAELPELLPELLYFALVPYLGHRRALAESAAAA